MDCNSVLMACQVAKFIVHIIMKLIRHFTTAFMNYKSTARHPIKLTLNHTINSFNSFPFHLDLFTCVLTKSCFDIAPTVPGGYSLVLAS